MYEPQVWVVLSRSPHSVLLLYLHLQALLQEEDSMYEPQVWVVLSRSPSLCFTAVPPSPGSPIGGGEYV